MSTVRSVAELPRYLIAVFVVLVLGPLALGASPSPSFAAGGGTVTVQIFDQRDGLPVPAASVVLTRGLAAVATKTTDSRGNVTFEDVPAGTYYVSVTARGYDTTISADTVVAAGQSSTMRLIVVPASTVVLGRISVRGSAAQQSLQTTSTITATISAAQLEKESAVRVGDTLGNIPGVNLRAQSSAIGDDLYIDIRGMGAPETQTLLDGHPIGPIGVAPGTFFNGVPTVFDYQDTPTFALARTQVTYGSGALGLYGTDSIGGTVDMQTLDPTQDPQAELTQGIGNYGKATTALKATGTDGRLGYAFVDAVQGTYGNFNGQRVYQSGLNGFLQAPTPQTIAGLTYPVTADYLLRNGLAKFRYDTSPNSQLTLTGYTGTSWDDKSGNGDNDFNTFAYELYNVQQVAGTGNNSRCPGGIDLNQGSGPTPNCISAAQAASYGTGPAGGGPAPWQAIRNQDYHGRYTVNWGRNAIVADGYFDNYALDYNRNCGSIDSVTGQCNGGYDSAFTRSTGFLLSDDIVLATNDFGFGYYVGHQHTTGDVATQTGITPMLEQSLGTGSVFLRDVFSPNGPFTYYGNVWFKKSSVTHLTTVDPRVTVQYRPTDNSVWRITAGRATGEPAPSLLYGFSLNTTPQNINPNCSGLTSVGGLGNPNVGPENANDLELAYGHRFTADTAVQIAAYASNETDQVYSVSIPATQLPPGVTIPNYLLTQYFARITAACGIPNPTLANLSIDTVMNASQARYRGVEVSGRKRFNDRFFTDYAYDIQSAVRVGVPDTILMANPFIINGAQIYQTPVHKWDLGVDYSTPNGLETRLDGYYIGINNALNRPAYFFADASVSKTLTSRTTLNLGIHNIFNNAADQYGRFGWGVFTPTNQFNPLPNALAEASERFGLVPTQIELTVTQKFGK